VQVFVRDNNVDQALRALKRKLQREGVFREMKLRKHYEKPSEKKVCERAEAVRRARKLARKKLQREGLLPPTKPRVDRTAGGRAGPSLFLASGLDGALAKKLLNPEHGEILPLIVHGWGNQDEVGAAEEARCGRKGGDRNLSGR
jgi:small subunit ribosomal protein S21